MNRKYRKTLIAGNWKMNKTPSETKTFMTELKGILPKGRWCDIALCVPAVCIPAAARAMRETRIGIGAENCNANASGAYTGEISTAMLVDAGCKYVIIGHSERRAMGETDAEVNAKVKAALEAGLIPIVCCGETLEEREQNKQNEVVKAELEQSIFNLTAEEWKNIVIAYEPIWAIGTGKTATSDEAEEMLAYIRSIVAEKYGQAVADETSILYGGSCKPSNAKELFAKPDIDGGLIGGASLKAADFKGIIDAWKD